MDVSATAAKTVSAAAVARACGVSKATVSYVMNGQPGVSADTRRRVIKVAGELGYRPATGPRPDPLLTRVVGLILPNLSNPMYTGWAERIISVTREQGFDVFVATTDDDPDTLAQVAGTLAARNVDGVIIAALLREDLRALRTLRQKRIPFVCLSRSADQLHGDYVGIDFDAAATLLMEHVLEHGYRELATVIGPRTSTASLIREEAFVRAAEAAGVAVRGARKVSTRLDSAGGRAAARSLLCGPRPPEAVVCGSDEIAIGVMEHAMSMGLRIPEDLAVVGGDGLPHSRSALINLTTVIQPINVMAERSFELLLDQIIRPRSTYHHVICEHRLHIGRTCGCPPVRRRSAPD
ncbi:LacI family transcriptional regulator [Mycolicibacterium neoaurum]|nr:LacI family transcriptional regulator [Mycolicibacterium neoaurum VKM Ac-1815D]KJQ47876.1 LacI family transcriptional regulator [Mycolicibacterium neoaurum]